MTARRFARAVVPRRPEHRHTFACFGGQCTVIVADAARPADAAAAAAMARRALLTWHERFSRFTESSELSRLNRDPAATVAVSPLMRRVIETGLTAARDTDGLVDITLADEIELAGYDEPLRRRGRGPAGGAGRGAAPGTRRPTPQQALAPDQRRRAGVDRPPSAGPAHRRRRHRQGGLRR